MRDFDAVIFDLDGVICYTDEYHYQAWKAMADSIGVSFDREINNRLRGVSRMASLDIVLEKYHGELSEAEKEELADQKNEIYKKQITELERTIDNLKLADAFKSGNADNTEARKKIDKLIKEIDKCITLMEG